ncbi:helix-turn-helix domain-containing protein [bacterium]|nr:helix-turn-helix domain-containing protein [bacterium]
MTNSKTRAQMFLEEQLKDPEVAQSFYDGLEELRLAVKIAQLREKRGLTQTQLAAKMNTSASVISRIENQGKCTIGTLRKAAEALDAVLQIDIAPREELERSSYSA